MTDYGEIARKIVRGSLTCSACQHSYPISEGIPNLFPPQPPGRK